FDRRIRLQGLYHLLITFRGGLQNGAKVLIVVKIGAGEVIIYIYILNALFKYSAPRASLVGMLLQSPSYKRRQSYVRTAGLPVSEQSIQYRGARRSSFHDPTP
ncbi:MAG: hypothetical protein ACKPKO_62515, partial [Candidatus Fonsibacter sp.]